MFFWPNIGNILIFYRKCLMQDSVKLIMKYLYRVEMTRWFNGSFFAYRESK